MPAVVAKLQRVAPLAAAPSRAVRFEALPAVGELGPVRAGVAEPRVALRRVVQPYFADDGSEAERPSRVLPPREEAGVLVQQELAVETHPSLVAEEAHAVDRRELRIDPLPGRPEPQPRP